MRMNRVVPVAIAAAFSLAFGARALLSASQPVRVGMKIQNWGE